MSKSALRFTSAFAAIQATKLVDVGASFLATLDPKSATEADIKTAESHYTNVLTKCAQARKAYGDAEALSSAATDAYEKELSGLAVLGKKAEEASDPTEKKRLSDKVDLFEAELAAKKARVQDLAATTTAKKDVLDAYETIVSEALNKFKTIQAQGRQAMDRLDLAREQEQIAREKADAIALGSSSGTSGFGVSALTRAADKAEISTQVSNEKAEALRPAASMATSDPDVAAAMAEASGQKPRSQMTMAERLASLQLDK
ncbi:hypothetical protein AA14337_3010 [Acetobacter malorum DSM 14337]|uniref:Uncharacterized protein n=1 Tax=Acetobacter malorum DSM 14337 TaxID=1307910 RepID=A0ABQ0PZ46_9PROT|nr:hypothetical protein [Acetobacter malorum]KXV05609.1 hypothetical protein AD930_10710 [Acetobacter malorum]GBQ85204.1 hypothetical protein AA14337_3010 [Acetobacter malorum DSM 14337]